MESVNFFFEPVQLDVEPPDLLVEQGDFGLEAIWVPRSLRGLEQGTDAIEELLAPFVNEVGVDLELGSDLWHGTCLFECGQGDFGPERGAVLNFSFGHP
jgi:hypothetical protein